MTSVSQHNQVTSQVAHAFAQARRTGEALTVFPGTLPGDLKAAYAIQLAAIDAWDDRHVGWKVGRVCGMLETTLGANRFIGPIFAKGVTVARPGEVANFPVFVDGFAAFEAEFIAVVEHDQPADRFACTPIDARDAISALHIGIEIAGSPLAPIQDLGAVAAIAAYGNNNGLILGPAVADFPSRPVDRLSVATRIDDVNLASAHAGALPGGLWAAIAFAFDQAARIGRPVRAGDYISTGAITGMHPVGPGSHCRADFGADGILECRTIPIH